MGTKIKSHLALLCFYCCYVSCCLCFSRWKIVRMMATVVIFFIRTICPASNFSFNSFSSVDADFYFYFFFLLFPCFLSGGQMRPVSHLCRSATSAAAFPVWRGKSRDMKAECVRVMVRGKEGEEEEERERGERAESHTIRPSLHLSPAISIQPSIRTASVRLAD